MSDLVAISDAVDLPPKARAEVEALAYWNRPTPPTPAEIACARIQRAAPLLRAAHRRGAELCSRKLIAGPMTPECSGQPGRALVIRDPARALTPPMRRKLWEAKEDLMFCLACGPWTWLTPREFELAGRVVRFPSPILREEILIAADSADDAHTLLRHADGRVVYRLREIRLLEGICPDELRRLHEVKRIFGGAVIGSEIIGSYRETGPGMLPVRPEVN